MTLEVVAEAVMAAPVAIRLAENSTSRLPRSVPPMASASVEADTAPQGRDEHPEPGPAGAQQRDRETLTEHEEGACPKRRRHAQDDPPDRRVGDHEADSLDEVAQRCLQVDPASRGTLLTRHPARPGMVAISAAEARKVSESTAKARATSPSITPEALKIPPTLARRANARAPTGSIPCGDQRQAVGRHPPLGTRLGTQASGWLPQQGERLQHERNRKSCQRLVTNISDSTRTARATSLTIITFLRSNLSAITPATPANKPGISRAPAGPGHHEPRRSSRRERWWRTEPPNRRSWRGALHTKAVQMAPDAAGRTTR